MVAGEEPVHLLTAARGTALSGSPLALLVLLHVYTNIEFPVVGLSMSSSSNQLNSDIFTAWKYYTFLELLCCCRIYFGLTDPLTNCI